MRFQDIDNPSFEAFAGMANASATYFPGTSDGYWYGKMRVNDRFDLILTSDYSNESIADVLQAPQPTALADKVANELYPMREYDYGLRGTLGVDMEAIERESVPTKLKQISEEVRTEVLRISNDPGMKEGFVSILDEQPEPYPYNVSSCYAEGKTPGDVLAEPVDVFYKGQGLPRDKYNISLLMDYLRDPEGTVNTAAVEFVEEHKEKIGQSLAYRDALASALGELYEKPDPALERGREILAALRSAFDGKPEPKEVWVNLEDGGRSARFRYPYFMIEGGCMNGTRKLAGWNMTPVSAREEFNRVFGRWQYSTLGTTDADFTVADIAKIEYGRKTVYEVPKEELEKRRETREYDISWFSPTEDTKAQIFDERPGSYRMFKHFRKEEAATCTPDGFEPSGRALFTAGATLAASDVVSEFLKDRHDSSIDTGCIVSVDGEALMLDGYNSVIEMPFKAAELEEGLNPTPTRSERKTVAALGESAARRAQERNLANTGAPSEPPIREHNPKL